MSRIGQLARETVIYGISSIIGRLLNWLLVPLYTQFMAPADYGIVTELYAYVAFLVILYTYGMETAFFRFATKDQSGSGDVFNQIQTSILATTLVFSVALFLLATPITEFLEYPGKERYIYWFAVILAIDSIVSIPFAKLRLAGKAKRFAVAKLVNIMINIGLNLFFIVFCLKISEGSFLEDLRPVIGKFYSKENLADYVFLSNLIANGALFFLLADLLLQFRPRFNFRKMKQIYIYAFPLLVMGLAGVTNEMLSRAMLKKWLPQGFYPGITNQAALGIFGAAYKLSIFMSLAIQAFRYAAEPFFFSRSSDSDSRDLFGQVMHWFIILGCIIFVTISLNLDIIGWLFLRSDSYRSGIIVVPVLLLANLFLGVYYNLSAWFKLTDKTYWGTIISIVGASITVILNIILIPTAGYFGSAMVTLVCYISMSTLSYFLGQKYYPIRYTVAKDIFYILAAAGLVVVGNILTTGRPGLDKGIHMALILFFLFLIYVTDRKNIIQLSGRLKIHENKYR
jgi:O-antigen/teichoic acid export membrane protein